ncbi:other/FunK1 protein kinase [Coprinopsis cinerea okayama7|uniref:Other/FunK1 protein kinase n=1 Tax=Coprinopsis cinerea (strain Okayama-7 / 130 / ATCC MYA-4618 / FGSC 9003) TaxID=240176 RepID=A8N0P3_COPC7|nr:other/FunK1 protein kinase [Coprinopsis cinerea okayama7\|eukprot:XP_001828375.2 other/FunK1 protein kinase [Coprinopsis cinerea okayama7\
MATSSHATTADEVKAAVVHDLDGQSRICSLHDLLKLLGHPLTDSEVDEVLGSLSDHYTQQTGWKGLPEKAVRKVNERAPESPIIPSTWLDCHSSAPKSNVEGASKIRPDLLSAILNPGDNVEDLAASFKVRDPSPGVKAVAATGSVQELHDTEDDEENDNTNDSDKPNPKRQKTEGGETEEVQDPQQTDAQNGSDAQAAPQPQVQPTESQAAPQPQAQPTESQAAPQPQAQPTESQAPPKPIASWLRTLLVAEVKPNRDDDWDSVIQLSTYLRQILREQHDRRFVSGIVIFHRSLSLWYCDRSGLLGADQTVDIDKDPKTFVRIMASFATMNPERLGFDPAMKMLVPNRPPTYSYRLPFHEVPKHRHSLRWEIVINKNIYHTVEPLSVARSEIMCGRATLVWRAFRLSDYTNEPNTKDLKLYIIKQSWRPNVGGAAELELYSRLGDFGGRRKDPVCHGEDVEGSNTQKDFRRGIHTEPAKDIVGKGSKGGAQQRTLSEPRDEHNLVHNTFSAKNPPKIAQEFMERVQCRLVIPVNGTAIKMFTSLKELVEALLDAVKEYEWAYYQKGICHRDISIGNIVMEILERKGSLIDFDHAKDLGPNYTPRRVSSLREELREYLAEFRKYHPQSEVSDNLALVILYLHRSTFPHVAAVEATSLYNRVPLFRWRIAEQATRTIRHASRAAERYFSERTAIHAVATGTVAFMSHKLLRDDDETHSAIHDMESLFWVVVFLCLTREGPGGKRRPEPKDDVKGDELYEGSLRRYYLFEAPKEEIRKIKSIMFSMTIRDKMPRVLEDHIFPWFHPFFKPLHGLLAEWWAILCSGFNEKGNILCRHYPVAAFRNALEKTRDTLEEPDEKHFSLIQQRTEMARVKSAAIQLTRSVLPHRTGRQGAKRKVDTVEGVTTPPKVHSDLPLSLDPSPMGKAHKGANLHLHARRKGD